MVAGNFAADPPLSSELASLEIILVGRFVPPSLIFAIVVVEHVAELVHLLTIDLHNALERSDTGRVKRIKAELERCYRLCARAVGA